MIRVSSPGDHLLFFFAGEKGMLCLAEITELPLLLPRPGTRGAGGHSGSSTTTVEAMVAIAGDGGVLGRERCSGL